MLQDQQKKFLDQQNKFQKFQEYVADNMIPIQELVLGPKRLSQRERDLEVERYTKSYKNASDKKAVGFLADLKIDIRERLSLTSTSFGRLKRMAASETLTGH